MSYLDSVNARNLARAQAAWDNATPDDDEGPDYDEQAADELLCQGGVIADSLSNAASAANPDDYATADLAKIGRDFHGMSAVQLLAVMASGTPEQATAALMQWRMALPGVMANVITDRAAEMAQEEADAAEEAKIDAYIARRECL